MKYRLGKSEWIFLGQSEYIRWMYGDQEIPERDFTVNLLPVRHKKRSVNSAKMASCNVASCFVTLGHNDAGKKAGKTDNKLAGPDEILNTVLQFFLVFLYIFLRIFYWIFA